MSLPIQVSNMGPGNPENLIFPSNTNLQEQSGAFSQEMTIQNDLVVKPPNTYLDGVISGLEDISTNFGASQPYRVSNPNHGGVSALSHFSFQTVDGFHPGNFKDGCYKMRPQLATTDGCYQIGPQSVIIDGFYQMQPQQLTIEPANGRGSIASSRKTRRMIKNRESAARSRARRQAYTSQLEIEVKNLKEENDMLKENLKTLHDDLATRLQSEKKLRPSSSAKF